MLRYLLSRLLQALLVIVVVYTITFLLLMLVGDPFIGEKTPPESVLKALRARYLIDRPAMAYLLYPWRVITTGDLGPTISYENWTVNDVVRSALPVSASLGCFAMIWALWLGIGAGLVGGMKPQSKRDLLLTILSLLGASLPTFVIASALVMLLGVFVPIFPTGGWGTIAQLILPSFCLALPFAAYIARLTRVSVLEVRHQDYIRAARAKGVTHFPLVTRHVLRNALLPVFSYLGPALAYLITGSFVVEKVFAIPGLGTHFVNACLATDIPLVLGLVLIFTTVVVIFNLLVDVAYTFVDPRVSVEGNKT